MTMVGDKIKSLREEAGLSQAALARRAGVSQPVIHALESGTQPTSKKLPQIARALGVTAVDIDPSYGLPGPPSLTPSRPESASTSAAFIEELARSGVEPKLIGRAYDALAAARIEGALARDRLRREPKEE